MEKDSELLIGLNTSKWNGEVRFFGDLSSQPASVSSMVAKLAK